MAWWVVPWAPGRLFERFLAGVDQGCSEAAPKEGETLEAGGCGTDTHLHPSILVALGEEIFISCLEFLLGPLSYLVLSPL